MTSFAPQYEIYFYDHSGSLQHILTGWEYLEFSQRINAPWNYIIRAEYSNTDSRGIFLRDDLQRDWIINIFRTEETTGNRIKVYEGFHRTLVEQTKQRGSIIFTLYGTGYTDLLKRRIIIPDSGQENKTYSGAAEGVIKNFVHSQMVGPADTSRIVPGFKVEGIHVPALGNTSAYSARYTNLFTVCTDVSEEGGVDFGIVGGTFIGSFVLEVRENWGLDKTLGNSDGNSPVLFDIFHHNMDIPIRSLSSSDEVNMIYVGGSNSGVNRAILEMYTDAKDISPWNRIESFVDARRETTTAGLETIGQSYLNKYEVKDTLSFNVIQATGTHWLTDFNLGDIVTARYFGTTFTKKFVEIRVVASAGNTGSSQAETINVEMEDV